MPDTIMPVPTASQNAAATGPDPAAVGFENPVITESAFAKAFKGKINEGAEPAPEAQTPKPDTATTNAPKPTAEADADAPPEVKSEQGKRDWKTWKQEHAKVLAERDTFAKKASEIETTYKASLAKLEADLAASRQVDPKEVETIRTQNKELSERLKLVALERTPEWETNYVKPMDGLKKHVQTLVGDGKSKEVMQLLQMEESEFKNERLEEIAGELSPVKQSQLGVLAFQVNDLLQKREEARADHAKMADDWQARVQRDQEQTVQQRHAEGEKLFKDALGRVTETIPAFQKVGGDDETSSQFNARIDKHVAEARELLLGKRSMNDVAEASFWAVWGKNEATPLLQKARAEIERLQAEVKSLSGVAPASRGGATGASGGEDKPMGFLEAVKREMTS